MAQLSPHAKPLTASHLQEARTTLQTELLQSLQQLPLESLAPFGEMLIAAPRIFTYAAGRSGAVLRMAAMRWMHLGLTVHVVGETTTPAIAAGDLLVLVSGSGTTPSVVRAAESALQQQARVALITAAPASAAAQLATLVIPVRAAGKEEHGSAASAQFSGSLFEQTVLLAFDTLFQALWTTSGQTAQQLYARHANIE